MNRRQLEILSYLLIGLLILSYTLYTATTEQQERSIELKIQLGGSRHEPGATAVLNITAGYTIKVYRHGQLIAEREKKGDPLSINWYKLLADLLFIGASQSTATNRLSFYDITYTSYNYIDTEQGGIPPTMYVAIGNGTGTPSRIDYKLFSQVDIEQVDISIYNDTVNQRFIVTLTKTFNVYVTTNITEVGLLLKIDTNGDIATVNAVYVLVCHDAVVPPIPIKTGDTISIIYRITIPYNYNGPFTKWFYYALINYMLGYEAIQPIQLKFVSGNTGEINTPSAPSGSGDYQTYIEVAVGNSTALANPEWEVYSLGYALSYAPITDPSQLYITVLTDTAFTITYTASFTFLVSKNITEVGLVLQTSRVPPGYYGNVLVSNPPDKLLLAYWSLPNAIEVSPGVGLRVVITVTIPYT